MSKDNLIILGVAGAALLLIYKMTRKKGSAYTAKVAQPLDGTPASYGWQYFSDGTSIDPVGNYYLNGVLAWLNPNPSF